MPQGDPAQLAGMFQTGPDPSEQLKGVADIAKQIMGAVSAFEQVPELADEAQAIRAASMSVMTKLTMKLEGGSGNVNPSSAGY